MPSYMNPQYKNASDNDAASAYGVPRQVDFGSNQAAQDAMYRNGYGVEQSVAYKNAEEAKAPTAYLNSDDALDKDAESDGVISYKNGGQLGHDPIVGDLATWMEEDQVQAPVAPGMSRMPDRYKGEDERWRQSRLDEDKQSKVHYLDEQEQKDAALKTKDGRVVGPDGADLTTKGNHAALRDSMEDAHIWAMGEQGDVRHADPKPRDVDATHHEVLHHSSLYGGKDVKCAGEMRVKDGFVKELNNYSGHYEPKDEQLLAAANQMSESGVNLDMARIQPTQGGGSYNGAAYLATQGDTDKMDAKDAVNQQITSFDRSTLKKVA